MIFPKQHIGIQRTARLRLYKIISAALALLVISISSQAVEVLDDSQSPKKQFNVRFEWEKQENLSSVSKDEFFLLKAHIPDVEVRLNTSNYIGKKARIYLALPSKIDGFNGSKGFSLTWKTSGIFTSGTAFPGDRALIFEGVIGSPLLTEFFTFALKLDATRLIGKLRYATIYEIELY